MSAFLLYYFKSHVTRGYVCGDEDGVGQDVPTFFCTNASVSIMLSKKPNWKKKCQRNDIIHTALLVSLVARTPLSYANDDRF